MRRWLLWAIMLITGGCAMLNGGETPALPQTRMTVIPHTPAFTPTPVPVVEATREPVCKGAPVSRLIVQERGRVTNNGERLNIRAGAGTRFRVIARMESGAIFEVIGGPECSDGYTWYQVRHEDMEGWIAEGDLFEYYAEPYLAG